MTLDKLNIKESASIINIDCDSVLKNRFYSFGIVKGSIIIVEAITLTRSTIEIKVNNSKIALRISEAAKIKVEKC
jgi:ferrous iron transport protein A